MMREVCRQQWTPFLLSLLLFLLICSTSTACQSPTPLPPPPPIINDSANRLLFCEHAVSSANRSQLVNDNDIGLKWTPRWLRSITVTRTEFACRAGPNGELDRTMWLGGDLQTRLVWIDWIQARARPVRAGLGRTHDDL